MMVTWLFIFIPRTMMFSYYGLNISKTKWSLRSCVDEYVRIMIFRKCTVKKIAWVPIRPSLLQHSNTTLHVNDVMKRAWERTSVVFVTIYCKLSFIIIDNTEKKENPKGFLPRGVFTILFILLILRYTEYTALLWKRIFSCAACFLCRLLKSQLIVL